MRTVIAILAFVLAIMSVSAYHTYDYTRSGYVIPSYINMMIPHGAQVVKSVEAYGAMAKPDFRKSAFRPITYAMVGPREAGANVRLLADTGAGIYVPYGFSDDMSTRDIVMSNRGSVRTYLGRYGVEKQAIKSMNS